MQNQTANHPGKWDRTGVIVECRPHDQYTVKIDATGRLTLRNRRYLRRFAPSGKDILIGIAPPSSHTIDVEPSSIPIAPPSSHTIDVEPSSVPITNSDEDKPQQNTTNADETITVVNDGPPVLDPEDIQRTDDDCNIHTPRLSMDTHFVRRSSRHQKPTRVYDANSGTYVVPTQR